MHSYEAMQKAIGGQVQEHVKKLGLKAPTLYKWMQPSDDYTDSGAYNPLDRIETVIETSLALGNSSEKALAPLYYLASRFNQIIFPAPAPNKNLSELHQELSKLTKEFGDVLSESGARLGDGDVSKKDVDVIKKEANELQRALSSFMAKLEEASKNS